MHRYPVRKRALFIENVRLNPNMQPTRFFMKLYQYISQEVRQTGLFSLIECVFAIADD